MVFYFYRVLIIFLVFHCKRVNKKYGTMLSSGNILNTVVWKEISNDFTAMISFKLITFCKILLNQICRRPALYKEVSQIIKIKRKKERHFWVKAQFFLVTFTLSSKNIVNQSQLNRTEPTL